MLQASYGLLCSGSIKLCLLGYTAQRSSLAIAIFSFGTSASASALLCTAHQLPSATHQQSLFGTAGFLSGLMPWHLPRASLLHLLLLRHTFQVLSFRNQPCLSLCERAYAHHFCGGACPTAPSNKQEVAAADLPLHNRLLCSKACALHERCSSLRTPSEQQATCLDALVMSLQLWGNGA